LHAPQLLLLVWVSMHAALHRVSPGPHTHTPPEHDVLPTHVTPHAPQFRLSVDVETHPPAHATLGAGHPVTHWPALHT
jgi:hypothetical protein